MLRICGGENLIGAEGDHCLPSMQVSREMQYSDAWLLPARHVKGGSEAEGTTFSLSPTLPKPQLFDSHCVICAQG